MAYSDTHYKTIFDNAGVATLVCQPGGSIISANKACCNLFNYEEIELQAKHASGLTDLLPGLAISIQHSAEHKSGAITGIKKNGSAVALEFTATSFENEDGELLSSISLSEISGSKKTTQSTSSNSYQGEVLEASYQEVFHKADNGIGIHECGSWRLIDINQQGCEIMNCSKEQLAGLNPFSLRETTPGHAHTELLERFALAGAGEPQLFEWRTPDFDGNSLWLEISLKKTNIAGADRILSFFRLINHRKVAEKQKQLERIDKEALINSTTDLMWSVDKKLCLIAANNAVISFHKSVTGITLKAGDALLVEGTISEKLLRFWHSAYARAFKGESFKTKIQGPPTENNEFEWFDVSFNPVYKNEEVVAVACYARNITESQRAAENLQQTILRYTHVTKATSDAVWDWDIKTNTVYFGETYQHLFGTLEEANTNVDAVVSRLHPDEKGSLLKSATRALKDGSLNWSDEHRFLKADGSYAFVSNKAFIIRNENGKALRVIGAMQDITRQKQEQQHLKLLESVILNTNDAVMITEAEPFDNPGPRIIYVNEAFTKMTGYTPEEVIGKTPRILQGPLSDKEDLYRLGKDLRQWQTTEITALNYKKNGETFWNNMTISPVANEKGWFTHWIAIERDVTEQKLMEIKLQELNTNLQTQAKELALSNTDLEQFAYIASHDLQEPLRMVSSFLNLLQNRYEDILDEKGKSYIHFAVDGAKRMRQLIMDLLEFSKVGRINEQPELVNPADLIDNIEMLFMKKIKETNATVKVAELPEVWSHKTPLQQVFQNIIGNALKYTLADRPAIIDIKGTETATHWQFSVQDNGIGVEPAYFEKIFVIFQRLHNKDEYSGTGMGLAVTKKIVENLGGTIWLESEPGKGSTFYFSIAKPAAAAVN